MKASNSKRRNNPKTSKGEHGAKRHPLSPVSKVLLGKGSFRSFRPIGTVNHK